LRWLQAHWCAGSHGALLADDMGLGKTVEALAFLAWLQEAMDRAEVPRRPFLVVAPTGLLQNWQAEHEKHLHEPGRGHGVEAFGGGLKRLRTTGGSSAPHGGELGAGLPTLDIEALRGAAWVITTYETLRDYQHSFGRVHWCAAVFDEAQKIKNPGIRLTEAALAMNVDFAITMTGTPVENRPADIWTLIDRAEPGWLGTLKEFSHDYERESDESELGSLHERLTKGAAPAIMLRRLKEDHLEGLPDKVLHTHPVEMPPVQAEAYEEAVLAAREGESALTVLHRIRSISLHPYAPGQESIERYILDSARLTETFRILDEIALAREKALIFVEAREMQDFLIEALAKRYPLPGDVLVINGAVAGKVRKERADLFQDRRGFDVMVLSPRAGGVGLNLTAARHVIHLARWWNPAVEDQCTDRIYRIGQEHTVHIHYPIARHPTYGDHSFDVKLDALLARKRDLNRRVLAPTAASAGDVDALFRSTVEEVRERGPADDGTSLLRRIDQMEPIAFERWVLRRLVEAGYDVNMTPYQDGGADGLAISRSPEDPHSLLLQCKHTQGGHACDHHAIEEVVAARPRYASRAQGRLVLVVVTNAPAFTAQAESLAQRHGVRLIGRQSLGSLESYYPDAGR
jgi:HJR/Mrr/RecB family endonuclease